MATVHRLFICPVPGKPVRGVSAVEAVADWGLQGCAHARRGSKRQVLLIDVETLKEFNLLPGQVKENVVTQGLDVNGLQSGQRLWLGEALLEVTIPCTPCALMESIRPGLKEAIRGRRGMLCRVLEGGTIQTGDRIELVEQPAAGAQD